MSSKFLIIKKHNSKWSNTDMQHFFEIACFLKNKKIPNTDNVEGEYNSPGCYWCEHVLVQPV